METSANKIPTHDPYTGELNPYYEELTGEKNPLSIVEEEETESFDIPQFVGKKFKYKGKYGLSNWTDTVKSVSYRHSIVFDKPFKIFVPKRGEEFKAEKINVVGFKYELYVISSRSGHHYELEDCVFIDE
jgi:hypothetical protein